MCVNSKMFWKVKKDFLLNFVCLEINNILLKDKDGHAFNLSFEESMIDYNISNDNLILCDNGYLFNEYVTKSLKDNHLDNFIQEKYDIHFFKDFKFDINDNSFDIDLYIYDVANHKTISVNYKDYIELIYFNFYDPDSNIIEFYNTAPANYIERTGCTILNKRK